MTEKTVIDPCCGSRMMWFDKSDPRAIFGDRRSEQITVADSTHRLGGTRLLRIEPDTILDFRALPFGDETFHLVAFDPPHLLRAGPKSWLAAKYGKLSDDWRGDNVGSATDEPLHTISAQGTHHAEVRAFLIKYYGVDGNPALREPLHTVTTKDRFGLVTIKGQDYAIVDIGLRMLTPRELYRAQGFPETYEIDMGADGKPLTKTAQVRMCGNSVCPPLSRAITAANYSEAIAERKAA